MMSPPKLPPVSAFRLLADLNEFIAVPAAERDKLLIDYMNATEQKAAADAVISAGLASAEKDRLDAAQSLQDAVNKAGQSIRSAETKAKQIVGVATAQSESVTATARKSVGEAADKVLAAEEEVKVLKMGLSDREASVRSREDEVAGREQRAKVAALDAAAEKAKYQDLIDRIRDVQAGNPAPSHIEP